MLQINSGKLYRSGVGRKNQLRGVLYSNLIMAGLDDPIATAAGTLLQAEAVGSPAHLVYELTEQMDDAEIAPGVLVSHTVQPYLQDFAALVSDTVFEAINMSKECAGLAHPRQCRELVDCGDQKSR